MSREEFAAKVGAALALPNVVDRRDALEPLLGYVDASEWAKTNPPAECSVCREMIPRKFVHLGVCVDCAMPKRVSF